MLSPEASGASGEKAIRLAYRNFPIGLTQDRLEPALGSFIVTAEAASRPQSRLSWIAEALANLGLAIPIAIGFLAQMAMVFVDNIMVGRLGADPLAAGGLGANLLFTPILLGMGVL